MTENAVLVHGNGHKYTPDLVLAFIGIQREVELFNSRRDAVERESQHIDEYGV